ncbi:MAG: toll/interleukin-1 receptor domain-containing protein [Bacteroidales bacterium]|nr:toll/interleukin-1 receptor domain-containing protein [Bacteroidales bacterium]
MKKGTDIFISYRRQGGREVARNLNDRLTMKGYSVFFDYESIRDGVFNSQIFDAIRQADDVIFILSKSSLDRCSSPDDWVRTELEFALKEHKHIILACPDEPFSGFPSDLPESLKPLTFLQIHFLNQRYYDASMKEIESSLHSRLRPRWPIFFSIGPAVILAALFLFLFLPKKGGGAPSDIVKVQCFLAKYQELSRFEGISFSEKEMEAFHYEDTLDGVKYSVYPLSHRYYLRPSYHIEPLDPVEAERPLSHPPFFTLRIINNGNKTIVINDAVVEVRNFTANDTQPVHISCRDDGYAIHGIGGSSCRIEYEIVDERTHRVVTRKEETLSPGDGYFVFRPEVSPSEGRAVVGYIFTDENRVPFVISSSREVIDNGGHEFGLPSVTVSGKGGEKELSFSSFPDRNLVAGETDDRFRFSVLSDRNGSFEMRVIVKTVDKQKFSSDWVEVSVFSEEYL